MLYKDNFSSERDRDRDTQRDRDTERDRQKYF